MMLPAKRVLLMITLFFCSIAVPVLAQDAGSSTATAAADSGGATGITTMVILLGLGALILVGGSIYMKENAKNGKEVD